jgi:hypothetical protein
MSEQKKIFFVNMDEGLANDKAFLGAGGEIYAPSWSIDATIDKLEWMVTDLAYDEKGVQSVDFVALCNAVDGLREYRNILREDGEDTVEPRIRDTFMKKAEPKKALHLVK